MSLLKQLAGETAIYGIGNIMGRILQYILLTPYLTRVTDNVEYGIHGIMYSFAALLLVFFTLRMETALFRFGTKAEDRDKAFTTASVVIFGMAIFFVSMILLNATSIADFLTKASDSRYVIYFALIITFDGLAALPFAKLRLENKAKRFVSIKIINVIITIVLTLLMISLLPTLIENGYTSLEPFYNRSHLLDYVFVSNLIASFVVLLLLLPEYLKSKFSFDKVLFKKMIRYSFPLIIVGVAGVINQLLDRFLIKELLPGSLDANTGQSGIYNAAAKIAILMNLFAVAFNYAAEPFFFKHASKSESKKIYGQVGLAFTIVGSLAFLAILLYMDFIQYLIGKDFREGVAIVPILLLAYFALGLYYNFSIWYKLADKTNYGAGIALSGSVITIGLNFYLLPRIGYIGSAWAALACFSFMSMAAYFLGRKFYPIDYPMRRILFYIGVAILVFILSTYLRTWVGSSLWITLGLNTVLLIGFISTVYLMERDGLMKSISK